MDEWINCAQDLAMYLRCWVWGEMDRWLRWVGGGRGVMLVSVVQNKGEADGVCEVKT